MIDQSIHALIAELDRGRQNWINGRTEDFDPDILVQSPEMTIFGPFGGGIVRIGGDFEMRQASLSTKFVSGKGTTEVVSVTTSGDLAVVVLVERNTVTFEGRDEPQSWVLRTTQVFRREDDHWVRLHRHADPLCASRTFDDTLAIARA